MRKYINILLFSVFAIGFIQLDNTVYNAKTLDIRYHIDKVGEPLGKNIRLHYDPYFKTFTRFFTNRTGTHEKKVFVTRLTEVGQVFYTHSINEIKTRKRLTIVTGNKDAPYYSFEGVTVTK